MKVLVQGDEAHLFVGLAVRPAARSVERRASLLVRRSILPGSAEDAADAALGSAGDWQPADSILEDVEPSPASTTSTTGVHLGVSVPNITWELGCIVMSAMQAFSSPCKLARVDDLSVRHPMLLFPAVV